MVTSKSMPACLCRVRKQASGAGKNDVGCQQDAGARVFAMGAERCHIWVPAGGRSDGRAGGGVGGCGRATTVATTEQPMFRLMHRMFGQHQTRVSTAWSACSMRHASSAAATAACMAAAACICQHRRRPAAAKWQCRQASLWQAVRSPHWERVTAIRTWTIAFIVRSRLI